MPRIINGINPIPPIPPIRKAMKLRITCKALSFDSVTPPIIELIRIRRKLKAES